MRIEDIASLEKAKTEIARLTIDNRNLKNACEQIKALLKEQKIMIRVDPDNNNIAWLYKLDGSKLGEFVEYYKDNRKEDIDMFTKRETVGIYKLNIAHLVGLE